MERREPGERPLLAQTPSEVLAARADDHQPGKGLCSPRNSLQWGVNGQILACHITGNEKMSVCFLYVVQKHYLNL